MHGPLVTPWAQMLLDRACIAADPIINTYMDMTSLIMQIMGCYMRYPTPICTCKRLVSCSSMCLPAPHMPHSYFAWAVFGPPAVWVAGPTWNGPPHAHPPSDRRPRLP